MQNKSDLPGIYLKGRFMTIAFCSGLQRLPHIFAQGGSDLRTLQAQGDRRGQEAKRVAHIVALTGETDAIAAASASLDLQGVGELDLAAASRWQLLDQGEDVRRDYIAARHGQVGWSL